MRTYVYVDGFNLYYRALRGRPWKWLNLVDLARSVLDPENDVCAVKYFTARVSGRNDPDEPRRQHAYLRALQTLPEVSIHYGSFLPKTKKRPLVLPDGGVGEFVDVHDTEEKGSDVALASHLLNDGWQDRYDVAVVLSQDTDLLEPIRMVKEEIGKPIGLVWLDGKKANGKLTQAASFVRHLTPSRLAAAQLPDPAIGRNGKPIFKPETW